MTRVVRVGATPASRPPSSSFANPSRSREAAGDAGVAPTNRGRRRRRPYGGPSHKDDQQDDHHAEQHRRRVALEAAALDGELEGPAGQLWHPADDRDQAVDDDPVDEEKHLPEPPERLDDEPLVDLVD